MSDVHPERASPMFPAGRIFFLMYQITQRRQTAMDARMAHLGMDIARWRPFLQLRALQPCAMTDLARVTALDRTTLTRIVDRLVKDGWVQRATPPSDRRQVLLTITPAGEAVYAACLNEHDAYTAEVTKGLSKAEIDELYRLVQILLGGMIDDERTRDQVLNLAMPDNRTRA